MLSLNRSPIGLCLWVGSIKVITVNSKGQDWLSLMRKLYTPTNAKLMELRHGPIGSRRQITHWIRVRTQSTVNISRTVEKWGQILKSKNKHGAPNDFFIWKYSLHLSRIKLLVTWRNFLKKRAWFQGILQFCLFLFLDIMTQCTQNVYRFP